MCPQTMLQRLQNRDLLIRDIDVRWQHYLVGRDLYLVKAVIEVDVVAELAAKRTFTANKDQYLCCEDQEEAFAYLSASDTCFSSSLGSAFALLSSVFFAFRNFLPTSSGVHQYTGYCRSILLNKHATVVMSTLASSISGTNIHPIATAAASVLANTAVAPPGGCTVFVALITKLAHAHPTAPETQL